MSLVLEEPLHPGYRNSHGSDVSPEANHRKCNGRDKFHSNLTSIYSILPQNMRRTIIPHINGPWPVRKTVSSSNGKNSRVTNSLALTTLGRNLLVISSWTVVDQRLNLSSNNTFKKLCRKVPSKFSANAILKAESYLELILNISS